MNNNDEYVGVDEKFKPNEEEKKEENLGSKIANDANNAYDKARDYMSDKDNQEKMKNAGKKGLKIAKGIGIGYLIFIGLVLVGVITIFIVVISKMFTTEKTTDDLRNKANNIIETVEDNITEAKSDKFNYDLETYVGTRTGLEISSLIDDVVLKVKKNTDHKITFVYNNTTTSVPDEMIKLKSNFDTKKEYEVTFDYDKDGYINKLTIFDK